MGVIFLKSESRQFISDCQSNIQNGQDVIQDLKSGSAHLMQAIDGRTLSGAAYTAGKGLFGDLIVPVITRFAQAIEDMQSDLKRYSSADQAIQAASTNKLDEAKLTQKIRECEAYRHTMKMTADALNSQAFEILAMSNPVTAMVALANQLFDIQGKLNTYVTSLDQDIEKLKNDLRLLQTFVSQTQGLFRDSTTRIKIAMQGISVLGKMTVNADGTYRFPKGMDKSWFEKVVKVKKNKSANDDHGSLDTDFSDGKVGFDKYAGKASAGDKQNGASMTGLEVEGNVGVMSPFSVKNKKVKNGKSKTDTNFGIGADVGVGISAAEAEAGFTVFGVKINVSGSAGVGLSASVKAGVTADKAEAKLKLGPFGLGLSIGG